ncbi:AAA family ATPase [Cytobacillus horneckiae]|uniref:HD domain-containing protein n=1 Tax=Cytobacillus horneckiae TaxID=549687 RepID=A0A2N0ZC25_9BACI|nr:AAA family ATPase [Cytobacillus horneckiae]MEC1155987.1 AAA family ATPase [Cytobacillus horneckiae]MED2939737.1 AAA family ATPase [Cytobacillus horneckiae]PKG27049.1 hypothetical protein CWS20_20465 [Cytobacillus horneckiae]
MSLFILMVGLPASGKSSMAVELAKKYDAAILSSDLLRQELLGDERNQDSNDVIFKEMERRTKALLLDGRNVLYDATNLNRKRRMHLVNHIAKADRKIVFYMNTAFDLIFERNKMRTRLVDEAIIKKMYKTVHLPVKGEGWDEVHYIGEKKSFRENFRLEMESLLLNDLGHDHLFDRLSFHLHEFKGILNLPQDSSYHSFSVSRHTYHVYHYLLEHYIEDDKLMMLWAALYHDTGKAFCKSFANFKGEETKYANFIGHEFVSSQLASSSLYLLGYNQDFIQKVVELVQLHMVPMNASEKKLAEIKKLIGTTQFNKLLLLHEADMQAK